MNKALGVALLAGGIVMLVFGFNSKDSLESEVSEAFRGKPSNNAVWLLGGGAACTLAGAAMVFMKK